MSAPQHPNQPPPAQPPSGPFAAPDPTVAIGGPGAPGGPGNVDATQVVQGNDQPERTQVVRPGATPNGAISQQPEATQVVRPGAPQPQPQGYPQPQQYGQPPPGYPQPQAPGFGQQLAQPPGYPPQQPAYPPQQPGYPPQPPGYGYPQQHGAPYQYGGPYQYATWGQRAVGGLIDYGVTGALMVIIIIVSISSGAFALISLASVINLVNIFYNISYLGGQGQTLGKKVAGIKLIREDSGQPVGFGLAFGRALTHVVDGLPLYIGFLAPLWEVKRQTWADKILNTVVIVAPQAGQGYQAPQQYGQMPRQW
jgi:uncharacterized RDD family membrane protein YckC